MVYLWIFAGCYGLASLLINLKLNAQSAHMKARLRALGMPQEKFDAELRQGMPLAKEIFIRLWSPVVFSVVPAALLSLGYFLFS